MFPLQRMKLRRLRSVPEFTTVAEIQKLYARLKPDARKVSEMIHTEANSQAEDRVLGFLRRAVKYFSDDILFRFLGLLVGVIL